MDSRKGCNGVKIILEYKIIKSYSLVFWNNCNICDKLKPEGKQNLLSVKWEHKTETRCFCPGLKC